MPTCVGASAAEETDMVDQPGIIPHLIVNDAAAALEFYKKALGATEILRMPTPDGKRLLHAEMQVNGAKIFMCDAFPEQCESHTGHGAPPKTLGGTTVLMHLGVADCDAAVTRAVAAGATVTMEPWDAFWGARYGQVRDPFGHAWSFAHPLPVKQA
jgi:PhnB protein